MNRIFIDMDGVTVDFDKYKRMLGAPGEWVKVQPGAYLAMEPMEGAIEAILKLLAMGWEVWLATKPPTGVAHAYGEKAQWVFNHLPQLKRRIIITHDKGLLGDADDFLVDDRPHKANCDKFQGTLIVFKAGYMWPEIVEYFESMTCHGRPLIPEPLREGQADVEGSSNL